MKYTRIKEAERMQTFIGLYKDKLSATQIAKTLHKSPSSITRNYSERKINKVYTIQ